GRGPFIHVLQAFCPTWRETLQARPAPTDTDPYPEAAARARAQWPLAAVDEIRVLKAQLSELSAMLGAEKEAHDETRRHLVAIVAEAKTALLRP
ncbi:MAG TPA: hypothetical protein VMQ76_09400, partial [Terracidiphilus sp.]|nr:hypothetical protein [Terracidiphilus sp.]